MKDLDRLVDLFERAQWPVIFTGAGVSTESGIPDFRSPGGVWDRYKPINYRDFLNDAEARRETWRRGLHTYPLLASAEPNPAHRAIAELERLGRLHCLITQNIDGLHQKAGNSPELIVELHGNAHRVRCLHCQATFQRSAIHTRLGVGEAAPPCEHCGGWLKPATVSFGEPMPVEAMRRATTAARQCDLFVVVGSSLVVYPAAGLPETALESGSSLVIVNASETHLDDRAMVRLKGKAGRVLNELLVRLRARLAGLPS